MSIARTPQIVTWLRLTDVAILISWCIVAHFFPVALMSTQGYVTAFAWYIAIITVGGQNPLYLHPRYRILVSMGLALGFAIIVDIFWAGDGHRWYTAGGLHSALGIAVLGTLARFILAQLLQRPAIQIVPCRLPAVFAPLLTELAQQAEIFVDVPLDDPAGPLPEHRSEYPFFVVLTDLRVRETEFRALMPLYSRVDVVDICAFYEHTLGKAAMVKTPEGWVLPHTLRVPSPMREVVTRLFDVIMVLMTLPITLPIVALAVMAIKLTSRGPVFFRQERVGRYGRSFMITKLRTMRVDADTGGAQWADARDTRSTPVGRLLRVTGIDELPQFWNVLHGDMSLVGPRPEQSEIVNRLRQEIPFYEARLLTMPGIAGWAQLHQGGDVTLDDVANKLRYDIYYIKNASLALNLRILLGTMQMLLHLAKPKARVSRVSAR